jgi:Lrp/AsnC family transcriptional regulator for asnA, asnC and gidA
MVKIDEMDLKILSALTDDASISVPKLSKKIDVNASVIYGRIKRLVRRNIIEKFTIEVNEESLGYHVTALVELDTDKKKRNNVLTIFSILKR